MKVLLDTNVLVAAFATRGICHDVLGVALTDHRLVVGQTNLDELTRILREKLGLPAVRIQEVVEFVNEHSEVVVPAAPATWPESDPDDRWIVASAIDGGVDLLVTGDKDLLAERHDEPFRIVTPRGFWDLLHLEQ